MDIMQVSGLHLNYIHTYDWTSVWFRLPKSIREMRYTGTVMSFMLSNKNILGLEIRLVSIFVTLSFLSCVSMLLSRLSGWPLDDFFWSVMYIPAVPLTPQNQEYIERQRESFLSGERPPDFPQGKSELSFVGVATVNDIVGKAGRRAMGFKLQAWEAC